MGSSSVVPLSMDTCEPTQAAVSRIVSVGGKALQAVDVHALAAGRAA